MNIRIGNDIKVKFTINNPNEFDYGNVKQMRVYFVNSALENFPGCPVKRFPKEPFPQFYTPSKYTLHGCGRFEYNVNPNYRKCEYAHDGGFHDAHLWPYYDGFGVKPDHFIDCCPDPSPKPMEECAFLAPSKIESGENEGVAYFPACEQRLAGPYKMIVVLVMYESGWARNNLHTYTMDYGTMFNLVEDEGGMCGNITINGNTKEIESEGIKQINVASEVLYLRKGSKLKLGETDTRGELYDVTVILENGSAIKYRYDMWQNNRIKFDTSDINTVSVDYQGTLDVWGTNSSQVTITVSSPNGQIIKQIVVMIITDNVQFIGFAPTEDAKQVDLERLDSNGKRTFFSVDELSGNYQLNNTQNGNYLWIFSNEPIKDIDSSMFDVPLASVQRNDKYNFCYHCPNALIPTSFDITINK